jgi:hypothetical protein
MNLPEGFKPLTLVAVATLLVFAVIAGALMSFGFFCGCRYAEAKTMATVYKVQLDKAQDLMRGDMSIANTYKDGIAKARK